MSDRHQRVGAVLPGTLRSQGVGRPSPVVRMQRRKSSLVRVLVGYGLMALVFIAAWLGGLRPYLHELAQKQIDGVLSNAVNQIDLMPVSTVPHDPISLPVTEMVINNLIVLYTAPSDPVQHMHVQIAPAGLHVDFLLYGFACEISAMLAISNGQLIFAHVTVEGIVSLIMSSDELTSIVNTHLREAGAKLHRNVVGVILKNHELDLTLS
jgi:hypothetical protein